MNTTPTVHQVDLVLKHIKELIYTKRLYPGDRLPAERRLATQLGVSRAHVRTAFQKLEFYGIVKTFPQSGTVVAQEKMQVLESLITDALKIDRYDFASLVHVRGLLEIEAVRLCVRNRTESDLQNIEKALAECESLFHTDERVNKDFAYHQAIAQGGHNPVIASLLLIITPDVLRYYQKYKACSVPSEEVFFEHRELLRFIREQREEEAVAIISKHLTAISEFSQGIPQKTEHHFLEQE
ncbi:MAG: FadR family transcriptional regulator [Alistipes sp.]|nr:FadR family transcriptional regulator [Alistipes sp.]